MWAEPCLIDAAKEEYNGVIEEFLATGEKLFGPYVWGRCGITSIPMSFVNLSPWFPPAFLLVLLLLLSPRAEPAPNPRSKGEEDEQEGGISQASFTVAEQGIPRGRVIEVPSSC